MLLCFITRRILWIITPNTLSCTSVLLMTFLPSGVDPKVPSWNSLTLSTAKLIESNLLIVLAKVPSLFWICFSIEIPLLTCCNFPPFKNLLTNTCTYHSSRFTLLAIRKPSLKGNLWGMLETVLPLIRFMKQGKSSGSDYELGGIHSDFCFHCFVKYDTVTERNGFTRSLRIGLA